MKKQCMSIKLTRLLITWTPTNYSHDPTTTASHSLDFSPWHFLQVLPSFILFCYASYIFTSFVVHLFTLPPSAFIYRYISFILLRFCFHFIALSALSPPSISLSLRPIALSPRIILPRSGTLRFHFRALALHHSYCTHPEHCRFRSRTCAATTIAPSHCVPIQVIIPGTLCTSSPFAACIYQLPLIPIALA